MECMFPAPDEAGEAELSAAPCHCEKARSLQLVLSQPVWPLASPSRWPPCNCFLGSPAAPPKPFSKGVFGAQPPALLFTPRLTSKAQQPWEGRTIQEMPAAKGLLWQLSDCSVGGEVAARTFCRSPALTAHYRCFLLLCFLSGTLSATRSHCFSRLM